MQAEDKRPYSVQGILDYGQGDTERLLISCSETFPYRIKMTLPTHTISCEWKASKNAYNICLIDIKSHTKFVINP